MISFPTQILSQVSHNDLTYDLPKPLEIFFDDINVFLVNGVKHPRIAINVGKKMVIRSNGYRKFHE